MRSHNLIGQLRNKAEKNVSGLRTYEAPPATYRKYVQGDNGQLVYLGEFETPQVFVASYYKGNRKVE